MHDDFGAKKFSAFVPRRMIYHTQVARSISIRAFVCLCVCAYDVLNKYNAYCLGIFGSALLLCILVFVHLCICVFTCVCVQAYVITGTWQGH